MSNESTERNSCVPRSLKPFLSVLFLFYKSASRKLTGRPWTNRYLSFWHFNHQFKDSKWICRLCDELTCIKIFPPLLKRCLSSRLHITQTVVSLPLTPSHFLCDFISCSRDVLIHFSISSVSFYSCYYTFHVAADITCMNTGLDWPVNTWTKSILPSVLPLSFFLSFFQTLMIFRMMPPRNKNKGSHQIGVFLGTSPHRLLLLIQAKCSCC